MTSGIHLLLSARILYCQSDVINTPPADVRTSNTRQMKLFRVP